MKRFKFSLEKVLRLRSQETEQAKRALGRAMEAEEAARQSVESIASALAERITQMQARERAGLSAAEFGVMRHFLLFLQRELDQARGVLEAAQQVTQQRRLELLEARRRERALEKLKEHRLEGYLLESLREEQKELDEYANRLGLNGRAPDLDT